MDAMIKIVMPTSFEEGLLSRLHDANQRHAGAGIQVAELYGSLPRTSTGTGRPRRSLPSIDRAQFTRHVDQARRSGFGFTALFNTSCTGNREFDPAARRRIRDEILRVRDAGCTAIVVASPFLIDLAVKHAADLRVHVSSVAFCKSTKEARHYLRRGARRLILDPDTIRDFGFIRRLRNECPELELEALCNHPCLLNCPYETYCYNAVSHSSCSEEDALYEGFSLLRCNADKLSDPAEFAKGSWFRPQDIHFYEDAGVHAIKIAGRGRSTEWLARTAEAYLSRDYQGDMMDLIWEAQLAAVWRATGREDLPRRPIQVDASAFDGFLEFFWKSRPDCQRGCGSCTHCSRFAEKGVRVDAEASAETQQAIRRAGEGLLECADA